MLALELRCSTGNTGVQVCFAWLTAEAKAERGCARLWRVCDCCCRNATPRRVLSHASMLLAMLLARLGAVLSAMPRR